MIVTTVLLGGAGNNLFQIATVLAYSFKHNCDYCIPTTIQSPHSEGQKVFHSPHLKYCDIESGERTIYVELHFHYREIPKFDVEVLVLSGYWQSEKYFLDYRNEIIKMLNIPYEFRDGWCSIQVRRGDYLNLPNVHPVVTNEYLQKAQIYMIGKGIKRFLVVSDDIEWCKNEMPRFDNYYQWFCEYEFSEGKTEVEDLVLASSCEYNIGSNSSFAWWCYWLNQNENKIGVFPRTWFGESMNHDTKDLYMPQMILL